MSKSLFDRVYAILEAAGESFQNDEGVDPKVCDQVARAICGETLITLPRASRVIAETLKHSQDDPRTLAAKIERILLFGHAKLGSGGGLYEDDGLIDVPRRMSDAALHHAEDSDPAHLVGDLQDLAQAAWDVMTPMQRAAWLQDHRVINVFQNGHEEDRAGLNIPEE